MVLLRGIEASDGSFLRARRHLKPFRIAPPQMHANSIAPRTPGSPDEALEGWLCSGAPSGLAGKRSFQRLCGVVLRILLGDLLPVCTIVGAVVNPAIQLEVLRVRRICTGRRPAVQVHHLQQR